MKTKSILRYRTIPLLMLSVALSGSAWLFVSCTSHSPIPRNVLLISIDTCRADHLGCYGYDRNTTPHIDQLTQQSIVFTHTYTPVPMTLPAHSSMLTGTIPPCHGVHDNSDYKLGQSNVTLAEILGNHGFVTGAVVSSFVLDSQFGLNQGFSYYNDRFETPLKTLSVNERRGEEATRFAIKWIDMHKKDRFFLFLHYYDPHAKYIPPEPFASRFRGNPYAGEIAYTDDCIGHVIDKLKDWGLFDSTLIVITGDHGEMLGEHREIDHMYFIYQSALRVPLIFKPPGHHKGARIAAPAGTIDIVPTVCAMLGIKGPDHVQGQDLSAYFDGKQAPDKDRYLYCESLLPTKYGANSLMGVVGNRWKYIQTTRPELYDIIKDPGETHNLIKQQPQRARILQDRLRRILEASVHRGKSDSRAALDEEGRNRLESLGYLAGTSVKEDFAFDQTRDDPKDLISFHVLNASVFDLFSQKKYEKAETTCEKMLKQRPRDIETHRYLAKIASAQNNYTAAVSYLTEAIRLKPDDARLHNELGNALLKLKMPGAAIKHFNKAISLRPENHQAYALLASVFTQQGNYDQAVQYFKKALEIYPEFAEGYNNLGLALEKQGKFNDAIAQYSEALRINPAMAQAHNNLGLVLEKQGKRKEAIDHYVEALRIDPENIQAHNNLGRALEKEGRLAEATEHFSEVARIKPDIAEAHNNLGIILAKQGKLTDAIRSYSEALRIKPDDAEAHYNLAIALAKQNRINEAISHYGKALQINPDYADVHYNLAIALAKQGKFNESIRHYTEAIRIRPGIAEAHNNLGIILGKQGRLNEAIKQFSEAVRIKPTYDHAHNNLGVALLKQGKLEKAIKHFSEAVRINPKNINAKINLEKTLEFRNKLSKGK